MNCLIHAPCNEDEFSQNACSRKISDDSGQINMSVANIGGNMSGNAKNNVHLFD